MLQKMWWPFQSSLRIHRPPRTAGSESELPSDSVEKDGRLHWVSERSAASVWDNAARRWSCHFKWGMGNFIFLPGTSTVWNSCMSTAVVRVVYRLFGSAGYRRIPHLASPRYTDFTYQTRTNKPMARISDTRTCCESRTSHWQSQDLAPLLAEITTQYLPVGTTTAVSETVPPYRAVPS